ncbi:MAG: FHA domain-containing protein [Planctomycetota bacterium]|nr:MAG: FHA domain-containing protein [Planctomycetota bacterium]
MVPLVKFLHKLQGWDEKEFLSQYTFPLMVTSRKHIKRIPDENQIHLRHRGRQFSTMISSAQSNRIELEWLSIPWVCIISKREGGEMQMVNLGRTSNNDIVIPLPVISKFHCCFFVYGAEEVYLVDGGSTNGTFLNDTLMEENQKLPLHSGDHIRFGPQMEFEFFFPKNFWEVIPEYHQLLSRLPSS